MEWIACEVHPPIGRIVLARPEARNAISGALAAELAAALALLVDDRDLRVILLSARGPVFAAGGDLKELAALPLEREGADAVLAVGESVAALERCPLPVVALVQGPVFGGGAELLLHCDVVILSDTASVRFVHGDMGLVPAWGGATRLVEKVGRATASDWLLSGRTVVADEIHRSGWAAAVHPAGEAEEAALAYAEQLARRPREALIRLKAALVAAGAGPRDTRFARERALFREAWGSEPHRHAFARLGVMADDDPE